MRVEEEDEEVSGITGSMARALPFALPFAKSSDDPNIASGCGEIQSSQSILSQWRRSTHPINRPSGMGHGADAAEAAAAEETAAALRTMRSENEQLLAKLAKAEAALKMRANGGGGGRRR